MSGFQKRVSRGLTHLAMSVLFLVLPVQGAAQMPAVDDLPEMEMLDFLGAFEDVDTGWVDPFILGGEDAGNATREEAGHVR